MLGGGSRPEARGGIDEQTPRPPRLQRAAGRGQEEWGLLAALACPAGDRFGCGEDHRWAEPHPTPTTLKV